MADARRLGEAEDRAVRIGALPTAPFRSGRGSAGVLIFGLSFAIFLFHTYTTYFGQVEAYRHRSAHVFAFLVVTFLFYPSARAGARTRIPLVADLALIASSVAAALYFFWDIDALVLRFLSPGAVDLAFGTLLILLVLEATRRVVGSVLVAVVVVFSAHAVFGNYFPGVLHTSPVSYPLFLNHMVVETGGLFGIPIDVMSSFIIVFIFLGSLLQATGAGQMFLSVAISATRRTAGGPAKSAVVASALFGTISGSAVSNVVTTGSVTIPLMKRSGFSAVFAGGVEAVASSGGQIMPPVMGAGAFIMAFFLHTSYLAVAKAAAIPAILYFASLYFMVHFEARKQGMRPGHGVAAAGVSVWRELGQGWYFLLPIAAVVYFLVQSYSAATAGLWGIVLLMALSFIRRRSRLTPEQLLTTFVDSVRVSTPIVMACAAAGMIIGAITISGIGDRFTQVLVAASSGQLWLVLVFTALASFILGMGLTTTADYLTLVAFMIPALIVLGAPPVAAHMFAFYWSSISGITPPVALASFAAAGVAGANMTLTGIMACRIGIAAFVVPFMFVYRPELLLVGTVDRILVTTAVAVIGILSLAAGVQGWLLRRANWLERAGLIAAAVLLVSRGWTTDVAGLALFGAILAVHRFVPYVPLGDAALGRLRKVSLQLPVMDRASGVVGAAPSGDRRAPGTSGRHQGWEWLALAAVFAFFYALGRRSYHTQEFTAFMILVLIASHALVLVLLALRGRLRT